MRNAILRNYLKWKFNETIIPFVLVGQETGGQLGATRKRLVGYFPATFRLKYNYEYEFSVLSTHIFENFRNLNVMRVPSTENSYS